MYLHTEAFRRLREQTQSILDFSVLICNAVPLLKMTLKKIDKKVHGTELANPDYFKESSDPRHLREYAKDYKNNLSKYILISNFSYFEAYLIDAINEIFLFHGGSNVMIKASQDRCKKYVNPTDEKIRNYRRKLQDAFAKHKHQKYKKHTKLLQEMNFKFPSELLASYGIIKLKDEVQNLRSVDIPNILTKGLHFDMNKKDCEEFHRIRKIRNSIAHGKRKNFDIPSAMACNRFLRELAVRIDSHIVNNFFVIETFS